MSSSRRRCGLERLPRDTSRSPSTCHSRSKDTRYGESTPSRYTTPRRTEAGYTFFVSTYYTTIQLLLCHTNRSWTGIANLHSEGIKCSHIRAGMAYINCPLLLPYLISFLPELFDPLWHAGGALSCQDL